MTGKGALAPESGKTQIPILLCDFGQEALPAEASVSSSVKWRCDQGDLTFI